MPIDEAARGDMVAAYRAGEGVSSIASRHAVPRSTLYAVLRSAGVEPSRSKRERPLGRGHRCVVCGELKPLMPSGHRSGQWYASPTCGHPACASAVPYIPHEAWRRGTCGPRRPSAVEQAVFEEGDVRAYGDSVRRIPFLVPELDEVADERLADVPASAAAFPWSGHSTISVAIHAESAESGEIGIRLRRPVRQALVEDLCGGDEEMLRAFDVVFAWRCRCPEQYVVLVQGIDDLPTEPGFYGACPRCGAVAIEVLN